MYKFEPTLNRDYTTGQLLQAVLIMALASIAGLRLLTTLGYSAWLTLGILLASTLLSLGFLAVTGQIRHLRDQGRNLRAVLETTRDSIIVVDEHGIILESNPATTDIFGYRNLELIGAPLSILLEEEPGELQQLFNDDYRNSMAAHTCLELNGRHKKGDSFSLEASFGQMPGRDSGYVCVMRDITERKIVEESLLQLASTDPLTGAMNRRAFLTDGERLFSIARRFSRELTALALDADYFKRINDRYGHDAGDKVLVAITETLKQSLRRVDLISRFGGEEFVILLPETGREKALFVAEKLRHSLAALRVPSPKGEIRFTCSIGVSSLQRDCENLGDLLRHADQALYEAKQRGRNQSRCHQPRDLADVVFLARDNKQAM